MAKKREIYTINPSKRKKKRAAKKRTTKKRKVSTMAKKRKRAVKRRKRTYRRNPAKRRTTRRRSVRRTMGGLLGGLNFKKAIGDMPAIQMGMFAAKWASKRFGSDASETDPGSWTWDSYLKGAIGGVGAAILMNQVKRGTGQKVLEGALNLMTYKAIQNELIAGSDWATGQFGEDYEPDEYLMTGADENWFLGKDGNMYPTSEDYRLPEAGYGEALQPVTALGDSLQPVTALGAVNLKDQFKRAYDYNM